MTTTTSNMLSSAILNSLIDESRKESLKEGKQVLQKEGEGFKEEEFEEETQDFPEEFSEEVLEENKQQFPQKEFQEEEFQEEEFPEEEFQEEEFQQKFPQKELTQEESTQEEFQEFPQQNNEPMHQVFDKDNVLKEMTKRFSRWMIQEVHEFTLDELEYCPNNKQVEQYLLRQEYLSSKQPRNNEEKALGDPLLSAFKRIPTITSLFSFSTNLCHIEFVYVAVSQFLRDNKLITKKEYQQWMNHFLKVHQYVLEGHDIFGSDIYFQNLINFTIPNKHFLLPFTLESIPQKTKYFDSDYLSLVSFDLTSNKGVSESATENATENVIQQVTQSKDLLLSQLFQQEHFFYVMNKLDRIKCKVYQDIVFDPKGTSLLVTIVFSKDDIHPEMIHYQIEQEREGKKEKGIINKNGINDLLSLELSRNAQIILKLVNIPDDNAIEGIKVSVNSTTFVLKPTNHFFQEGKVFIDIVHQSNEETLILRDHLTQQDIVKIMLNNTVFKKDLQYTLENNDNVFYRVMEQFFSQVSMTKNTFDIQDIYYSLNRKTITIKFLQYEQKK